MMMIDFVVKKKKQAYPNEIYFQTIYSEEIDIIPQVGSIVSITGSTLFCVKNVHIDYIYSHVHVLIEPVDTRYVDYTWTQPKPKEDKRSSRSSNSCSSQDWDLIEQSLAFDVFINHNRR